MESVLDFIFISKGLDFQEEVTSSQEEIGNSDHRLILAVVDGLSVIRNRLKRRFSSAILNDEKNEAAIAEIFKEKVL